EEVAALEARHEQLEQLDTATDKYVAEACSQGKSSPACQNANALVQGLQETYNGTLGRLTYKELNREDYDKVSQIVANTTADKWDYAIENYAKSRNISYQEAKNKFALAININQTADIVGILYGLKGNKPETGIISASVASTLKQVLSKYNEFKQNIASSTKGSNDALAMAGAANVNHSSAGKELPPNAYLSTGSIDKIHTVKDYKSELNKGDKVNLELFNQRKSVSGSKAELIDPKTGWRLSPDRAGNNSHGGSAWKLLDKNGNRVATLDANGNVLRK
ncbi:DUF6862 domain-containing protein, partial [Erwinia sp.]|uniref:DUF6862 domain-containing protein n=1 Tax=Erwinia citreus TaxID=558 RepID=UPI00391700A0